MIYATFIIGNTNQTIIGPISEWQNILTELSKGNGVHLVKPDGTAIMLKAEDISSHDFSLHEVIMDEVKI